MNDRIPGSCYDNPIWYREKWRIYLGEAEVPGFEYAYCHDDYDGAEDAGDSRCGHASTVEEAQGEIDALEAYLCE